MEELENVQSTATAGISSYSSASASRSARAMARTVAGLVLQHPPMSAAPARRHSPTLDTKSVPVAPSESCKPVRDQHKTSFFSLLTQKQALSTDTKRDQLVTNKGYGMEEARKRTTHSFVSAMYVSPLFGYTTIGLLVTWKQMKLPSFK
jgi:hypothetical protein